MKKTQTQTQNWLTPNAIELIIQMYCQANGKTREEVMIENDLYMNS